MNKFILCSTLTLFAFANMSIKAQSTPNRPIGATLPTVSSGITNVAGFQKKCGTISPNETWNNWFNAQVEAFKEELRLHKTSAATYQIPVIVHVIHGGQAVGTYPNISQAQVGSQIGILNNDFAGAGLNVGNYSSTSFTASISNIDISFCAATKDPNGATLAEPGIERISYVSKGWGNPATPTSISAFNNLIENTIKPGSIWDPSKYLNIWVTDVSQSVGLLGYATFPGSTALAGITSGIGTATTDGVWIWSKAYGNTGTLVSPYDKGRTATHEVGHWLGLRHIGGDGNNNASGDCNATDYCNDTPPQKGGFAGGSFGQNYGAPTYPRNSGCSTPFGDMFMNFMDYTDDAIMYMFTPDQKARMQTAMQQGQFRTTLQNNVATVCGNGGGGSSGCSTVTAVAPSNTLIVQTAGCSGNPGYVYGTNCYNDKEKAEFFPGTLYNNTPGQLTKVTVLFFQTNTRGTFGNANTPVNLKFYQGTNVSGPTTLIGSTTVSMGVLNTAPIYSVNTFCGNQNVAYNEALVLPYTFNLSSAINVNGSGFYVSVEIPQTSGDTIVVLNNASTSANATWERQSNSTWFTMTSQWNGLGNKGMGILPVVCGVGIGLNETIIIDNSFIIKPNPSNGAFKVMALNGGTNQSSLISIYNVMGQLVFTKTVDLSMGVDTDIELTNVANGIYNLVISNGKTNLTKKICIQH
jgi:hypothetical protein